MDIYLTIKHIYPDLTDNDFMVLDDNQWKWPYIKWYNTEILQPTQAELEVAWLEIKAGETATQYQRDRLGEYPEIGEQLDMQYKDALNWTTLWQDKITEIKNKYPKPM